MCFKKLKLVKKLLEKQEKETRENALPYPRAGRATRFDFILDAAVAAERGVKTSPVHESVKSETVPCVCSCVCVCVRVCVWDSWPTQIKRRGRFEIKKGTVFSPFSP